jgi:hypothetical protein
MDIPLARGSFTWSNNQDPPSMYMIDIFLVYSNWEEHFPELIHCRLLDSYKIIFPFCSIVEIWLEDNAHLDFRTCG